MNPRIVKEYSFRGNPYKVVCVESYPFHPTWFTFEDESQVRDAFWDIRPGDRVLDIGAAFGSYTLCALACGASQVWAWSPQGIPGAETEAEMLSASLEANDWGSKCRILVTGLYDRDGYLHAGSQVLSETPSDPRDWEELSVETLEQFIRREPNFPSAVEWVKLDVEGAEVEVLNGGMDFIRSCMPKILVENHEFKKPGVEQQVRALLTSVGYKEVTTMPHHGVTHSLYVP